MTLEPCTRSAPNGGAEYQHRRCRSACTLSEKVISRIRISDIWVALGGARPRFKRAPAFWRDTQDRNVAVDDAKGTWFDHARGEGGGVLDLIRHVRGGSRAEALRTGTGPSPLPGPSSWASSRSQLRANHAPTRPASESRSL